MTQTERIVRHMIDYGSITPLEALQEYGVMHLASRMSDIKREGYLNFQTEMVTGKNRYGETTHYARYILMEA